MYKSVFEKSFDGLKIFLDECNLHTERKEKSCSQRRRGFWGLEKLLGWSLSYITNVGKMGGGAVRGTLGRDDVYLVLNMGCRGPYCCVNLLKELQSRD